VNDLARKSAAQGQKSENHSDHENLPSLLGRVGDDLSALFDLRLVLLKLEIKEEVDSYVRRGVTIAAGGVITMVGFALFNIALAFFISTLFAGADLSQSTRYGLGFLTTGLIYLMIGGVIVTVTKHRLAAQGIIPEGSAKEFAKDKQLLKSIIQN
jgi:hypothetical protein